MSAEQRAEAEAKLKGLTEKEKQLDETRKKDLEVHGEIRDLANAKKKSRMRGRDQEKRGKLSFGQGGFREAGQA